MPVHVSAKLNRYNNATTTRASGQSADTVCGVRRPAGTPSSCSRPPWNSAYWLASRYRKKAEVSVVSAFQAPIDFSGRPLRRRRMRQRLLEDKTRHARAGLQQRQDEQRLEHDDEVIPVGHQGLHARQVGEDLGHAHGQRDRAAGARLPASSCVACFERRSSSRREVPLRSPASTLGAHLLVPRPCRS